MPIFQRIRDVVSASIESLLDSVENREAVARARVVEEQARIERLREQVGALRARIAQAEISHRELERERLMWRSRARSLGHDREQGLACVRRMREVLRAQARLDAERQRLAVEVDDLEDARQQAASAAADRGVRPAGVVRAATDPEEEAMARAELDRLLGMDE